MFNQQELQSISEAYYGVISEAKIDNVDHVASEDDHSTLKSYGWDTYNPYESPQIFLQSGQRK